MRTGFSPALASWLRLAAILGTAAILRLLPAGILAAAPVICPFRRFAGIECYGCGMTHALHALVRGDVAVAFGHNALVLPWAGLAVAILLRDLFLLIRRARRHPRRRDAIPQFEAFDDVHA